MSFWKRDKTQSEDMMNEPNEIEEIPVADASESLAHESGEMSEAMQLRERIVAILKTVYDPEIPVDIYELGLIYRIDIDPEGACHIDMTLTSPACPVAGTLPPEVEGKVGEVEGVTGSKVEVVWDPPWHPGLMTEAAQLELGILY